VPDIRFLRINDRFALASDGIQWILQRREGTKWCGVSFVRSTRDVLARCMREKGVPGDDAQKVLDTLPDTFKAWLEARHSGFSSEGQSDTGQRPNRSYRAPAASQRAA
jgi:hypothetical protein